MVLKHRLHTAIINMDLYSVQYILTSKECDSHLLLDLDKDGYTAMELAMEKSSVPIQRLLKRKINQLLEGKIYA